ncbi:tetratricopeptide repeat protein [Winogradskyella psychrotolerans]|uniref:tetratricopeptide repeat protein n=1 Tax=Winogradskyella psychrotolerans TaxID=1344585 RepID=UPI001C06A1D1|nr:tetratricopeptide repeat protein [Winogradskyella psychrotolerans]MBU2927897.1 tetratricopeptide repeat protein [Winogradskyella psychrotolerans]
MEEQDYIQFEAFLAGNLSKDDLVAFNDRLHSDAQFKEAFEIFKDLNSNLEHQIANEREIFDFKANLDVISSQHFNAIHDEDIIIKPNPKSNFYKYAVAASVVILLGFFVFNQFGGPKYEEYNNFDPISLTVRSTDNTNFSKAEQSFNNKNYEEAIRAFNAILEDDFTNLEIQLYKGIALVETNQFEEADIVLNKIMNGNTAYRNKAKWILALSYLKQDNTSESIKILKTIPKGTEDYVSAQKLLMELD